MAEDFDEPIITPEDDASIAELRRLHPVPRSDFVPLKERKRGGKMKTLIAILKVVMPFAFTVLSGVYWYRYLEYNSTTHYVLFFAACAFMSGWGYRRLFYEG